MDSPFMVKSSKKLRFLIFLRYKKMTFHDVPARTKNQGVSSWNLMKAYEIHGGICSICPRKIWDLRRKSCIQTYPGGESPEFGHVWTNFPMTSCGKILQTQNPQEKMEKCYGKQLTNWFQLSLFFANLVLTWMVSEIWVSAVLIGPLPMASCFCPIHECSQRFPWSETAIAVFFSRLISLGSLVFAVCNGWLNTSALFLHHLASKYHRPNQIVLCSLTFQIFQGWTWS